MGTFRREYEPSIPLSQEELYEMIEHLPSNDLKNTSIKRFKGYTSGGSIMLSLGDFVIYVNNPKKSDIPITVESESWRCPNFGVVKERLESLLKFRLDEVPKVVKIY